VKHQHFVLHTNSYRQLRVCRVFVIQIQLCMIFAYSLSLVGLIDCFRIRLRFHEFVAFSNASDTGNKVPLC